MKAVIYIEGGATGANTRAVSSACREAFRKLFNRMGFKGRQPRLVDCGFRDDVYEAFKTANESKKWDWVAMWIDSEDPLADVEHAWKHLATVQTVSKWKKPKGATDDQVLLMTTCMETWIVADRAALRAHFGNELRENSLPPSNNLEQRDRHKVQDQLEQATKNCQNAYIKNKRSYAVLANLNPEVLAKLPSFARTSRILEEKLKR